MNELVCHYSMTNEFDLGSNEMFVQHYSISYYNSEIWHLPSLHVNLKQKLLSLSAKAIKMCSKSCTSDLSFVNLHARYNRATPEKLLLYKHALSLFKLFNSTD